MSAYLRQLESRRRQERDYGRGRTSSSSSSGEQSQAMKRSNSLESRLLSDKMRLIAQEETTSRTTWRKEEESLAALRRSLAAPVSAGHRRPAYTSPADRPPLRRDWLTYYDANGNQVVRKNSSSERLQTPDELRQLWQRIDCRRPRSMKALRESMEYRVPATGKNVTDKA